MTSEITPLLLTYNERENLPRTLARLKWARQVIVVDSFSTDETCDMAREHPGVKLVQRKFDSFANQCNFGLQHVRTPWVLSLDADYVLSDELVRELEALNPAPEVAGYSADLKYCIAGRPLRASLYPPRVVLYRRDKARYRDEGHGHRVQIDGPVAAMRGVIFHDDRKPLDRWLREQNRYMIIESRNLLATPLKELKLQDRLRRRIFIAPVLVFLYTLLAKGLILDGWPGWYYVFQRTLAETLLSLRLIEAGWTKTGAESDRHP